jgi:hypothetical protein
MSISDINRTNGKMDPAYVVGIVGIIATAIFLSVLVLALEWGGNKSAIHSIQLVQGCMRSHNAIVATNCIARVIGNGGS